ncbi:hypothetical protein GOB17_26990 [Sinorhizobium meliloti]|nr:hypothetical protein [Sinorhizobium meliloti]
MKGTRCNEPVTGNSTAPPAKFPVGPLSVSSGQSLWPQPSLCSRHKKEIRKRDFPRTLTPAISTGRLGVGHLVRRWQSV